MYWQVYLHKTSLVAEQLLIRVLKRAKEITLQGTQLQASAALTFFIQNEISINDFNADVLDKFAQLDDYDIVSAMKEWMNEKDFVLSNLCKMIINRDLLKIKIKKKKISSEKLQIETQNLMKEYNITQAEAAYFVFSGEISNQAYKTTSQKINILLKTGKVQDVVKASDQLNLKALSKTVTKYYICYPKDKL